MIIVKEYPRTEIERVHEFIHKKNNTNLIECVIFFCPKNVYKYQIISLWNGAPRSINYRKTI